MRICYAFFSILVSLITACGIILKLGSVQSTATAILFQYNCVWWKKAKKKTITNLKIVLFIRIISHRNRYQLCTESIFDLREEEKKVFLPSTHLKRIALSSFRQWIWTFLVAILTHNLWARLFYYPSINRISISIECCLFSTSIK